MANNKSVKPVPYTPPVGVPTIPTVSTTVTKKNMLAHNRLQSRGNKGGAAKSEVATSQAGSYMDKKSATKQASIADILRKLKSAIKNIDPGAEFRSVDRLPGARMRGDKLIPGQLYDPSTIHLMGKTKAQQRMLSALDYGVPAINAGLIQTQTGGLLPQPGESTADYIMRTTGAAATGLATAPVGLATILKRVPHARLYSGQADGTTSTMKGLLAPLLTKALVGGVGLAPSVYSDLKQFTGNAAGTAGNLNKGTTGMDLSKTLKQVGEGVDGVAAGLQGTSNAANQIPGLLREQAEAQLKAQAAQGKATQEALASAGKFFDSATGALNAVKDNWGWAAGGAGLGIGGIILAKRLMTMRENLAKEKTKQTALNRPANTKKRKLVIDPGDYDIDIKNFQVSPEHGIY